MVFYDSLVRRFWIDALDRALSGCPFRVSGEGALPSEGETGLSRNPVPPDGEEALQHQTWPRSDAENAWPRQSSTSPEGSENLCEMRVGRVQ